MSAKPIKLQEWAIGTSNHFQYKSFYVKDYNETIKRKMCIVSCLQALCWQPVAIVYERTGNEAPALRSATGDKPDAS